MNCVCFSHRTWAWIKLQSRMNILLAFNRYRLHKATFPVQGIIREYWYWDGSDGFSPFLLSIFLLKEIFNFFMYTDDEPFKSSSILRFICETSAIFALSSFFNLCPGDINREKARGRKKKWSLGKGWNETSQLFRIILSIYLFFVHRRVDSSYHQLCPFKGRLIRNMSVWHVQINSQTFSLIVNSTCT